MIVGTAGHIDHGKTSLVRALTGVDTDRLKEEKARGISIDLGFAYLPAPDGRCSASSTCRATRDSSTTCWPAPPASISCCWSSPPTTASCRRRCEHLAIVDLLGIDARRRRAHQDRSGRADAAGRGRGRDRAACLTDTALRGRRDRPGLDRDRRGHRRVARASVRRALARIAGACRVDGRFRLAVDRSFTLPGAGTVVTGTVLSGARRGRRSA